MAEEKDQGEGQEQSEPRIVPPMKEAPSSGPAIAPSKPSAKAERERAKDAIASLFLIGIICIAVGVWITGASQPSAGFDEVAGVEIDEGSLFGFYAGIAVASIGGLVSTIATVAWGVMLGNRASQR